MATKDKTDKATEALAALATVTLQDIDWQIQQVELQIQEFCDPLQNKLESLRQLRKVIDIRDNGKPERKPRQKRRSETSESPTARADGDARRPHGQTETLADRIRVYLQASGPMKTSSLASALGAEYQAVYQAVTKKPELFEKRASGEVALRN